MLPNPHFRPREPPNLATIYQFRDAHTYLQQLSAAQFHSAIPSLLAAQEAATTPLINLYTPYRAHDSALSTPSVRRAQLQENLLRRKTPTGVLPASYDAAPSQWSTRPAKHILLPLLTETGQLQHAPTLSHSPFGRGVTVVKPRIVTQARADMGGANETRSNLETWTTKQGLHTQRRNDAARAFPGAQQEVVSPPVVDCISSTRANIASYQSVHPVLQQPNEPVARQIPTGAGVCYYSRNGPANVPQLASIVNPAIPQLGQSTTYQANPHSITPAELHHMTSLYNSALLGWDQVPRKNSGQAQPFETIDALVTSPYPLPRQRPIVVDPVHHHQFIGGVTEHERNQWGVSAQSSLHPVSARSRVLSWAHGVYADLVQSLQAQSIPNVVPVAQKQLRSDSPLTSDTAFQSRTNTSGQHPVNLDNTVIDRRKKRRIDGSSDYDGQISGSPQDPGPYILGHSARHSNQTVPDRLFSNTLTNYALQSGRFSSLKNVIPSGNTRRAPLSQVGSSGGTRTLNPSALRTIAFHALDTLLRICVESDWKWLDGMLLGGCIAYALSDLNLALSWFGKILEVESGHVEALSNMGATYLALNRRGQAEEYWLKAVRARPTYFEAIEHLVALFCGDQRSADAVRLIEFVEQKISLWRRRRDDSARSNRHVSLSPETTASSRTISASSSPGMKFDYYEEDANNLSLSLGVLKEESEHNVNPVDYGRLLALIHAKGNMLYTLGDNIGAAKAFEDAVLIGAGGRNSGIQGLIRRILKVISASSEEGSYAASATRRGELTSILLTPERALQTARLLFPPHGELPGLSEIPPGQARKLAISTTSNSLLSLAKIFQDGMSSGINSNPSSGVREILALYYLSLALHPSPSTANNVGILLASVQHVTTIQTHQPNTGIALALQYYQYGLNLDSKHAHLYTNLGSLLKDMNNLPVAIKMYEQAVVCDNNFDIALANLANAVKDQGRTNEAIKYYRRAVAVSPNFAEAVCGLANALNSVCDWKGRGGVVRDGGNRDRWHVGDDGTLLDARAPDRQSRGWMNRVVTIVEKQLKEGENWGKGVLTDTVITMLLEEVEAAVGRSWSEERRRAFRKMVESWAGKKNEGLKLTRLLERTIRRTTWRWYQEKYVRPTDKPIDNLMRPAIPATLSIPIAPTVLPFHTFTCPLSAKQVRMISQRNGVRISCSTMRAPWLPGHVFPPPAPPNPHLNVGYVSSDFNNHPLAHLMQSVFGLHNPSRVKAYCYATTPNDGSVHRQQIEREAPKFYDASTWSPDRLIRQIIDDGIHILVNLNGFTRGARNEIFAARPAPIQMSFMGFAGTLGADWCDYLLADSTAVPPETLRPWRRNVDIEDDQHDDEEEEDGDNWVYAENIVFTKHSFFCCDHRQSAPDALGPKLVWDEEQRRRWAMRKEIFPDLPDSAVILGNFNQLYKIEPTTFRTWLRIIQKVPNARLWLLRFPQLGEKNLRELAEKWAGSEVAKRIIFTDVAPKQQHISRARVCDIFLDTPECNAHTTAADVTWSGTPLLTFPRHKHKMCSRIAASILRSAVPQTPEGRKIAGCLIANSEEEYERRAIELASGLRYEVGCKGFGNGELMNIRKVLYESRWTSPLFDTRRWVRDLETAYGEAWRRWVAGEGGDIWLD